MAQLPFAMHQAVIFDLYGTLLIYGDMPLAWSVWIADVGNSLRRIGVVIDREALTQHCAGFFKRSVVLVPGLVVYESRLHTLALELGGTPSLAWSRATAHTSMRNWQKEICLDPGVIPLLRNLHKQGIRCALLTNFDYPAHVHRLLEQLNLHVYFESVMISAEECLKKPDPQIFMRLLERLDLSPAQVVFVGDHPEQDIEGALGVGMHAVLLQRNAVGLRSDHVDFNVKEGEFSQQVKPVQVPVVCDLDELSTYLIQPNKSPIVGGAVSNDS